MEIECKSDWDLLKKILEEAPTENEYITYKGEKWIKENYVVPKQKIRDKIEELKERNNKWGFGALPRQIYINQIKILEELLGE